MPATIPVICSDPEILGGTPVFFGTRVPLRNLFDFLERNHSVDDFLDSFPTVSKEQVVAAFQQSLKLLEGDINFDVSTFSR